MKVFVFKTFMHVLKEQRSKLDDKATLCIFTGYGDEEFDYMLWDLEKQNIVRIRDVVVTPQPSTLCQKRVSQSENYKLVNLHHSKQLS